VTGEPLGPEVVSVMAALNDEMNVGLTVRASVQQIIEMTSGANTFAQLVALSDEPIDELVEHVADMAGFDIETVAEIIASIPPDFA
jgi:hypothetical protein